MEFKSGMPEVLPFRGYLYNSSTVSFEDVVAPPYDVISPQQQTELYQRNPFNIVRLILGREEDRYASAARYFGDWQEKGILVRDRTPAIYVLHQKFAGLNGRQVTRRGFIALCKLEEFEKKVVLPHEKTLAKPREDRFKLFKATNANFSQILALYSDPQKRLDVLTDTSGHPPAADVLFENVENKMWKVTDEDVIRTTREFLSDKQVFIADGHHRYETALAYRDFMRSQSSNVTGKEPFNYVMMFFTNLDDEGLVIYPTHRIVHSLPAFSRKKTLDAISMYFESKDFSNRRDAMKALRESPRTTFGLVAQGDEAVRLLSVKNGISLTDLMKDDLPRELQDLDVTILHSVILNRVLGISSEAQEQKTNLDYVKSVEEAIEAVHSGRAQLAFLMNATKIEEVRAVARAGFTMPQKSTYFYPKLLSGLVVNKLAD